MIIISGSSLVWNGPTGTNGPTIGLGSPLKIGVKSPGLVPSPGKYPVLLPVGTSVPGKPTGGNVESPPPLGVPPVGNVESTGVPPKFGGGYPPILPGGGT